MRGLAFWGSAAGIALVAAAAPLSADSGHGSSTTTTTTTGGAGASGWGGVPDAPLHPPMGQPGGWGPGGWQDGGPGMAPRGGADFRGPHPGRPGEEGRFHDGDGSRGRYAGRYPRMGRGAILPHFWLSPEYYLSDWGDYGLGQPGYGQNWIRYYDDALLIDGRGRVIDYRYGMDWDRGRGRDRHEGYGHEGYGAYGDGGYDYDYGYGQHGYHPGIPGPQAPVVIRRGGPDGSSTTVVVVQSAPVVTTTTTTTSYEDVVTYGAARHVWHRHRVWRPRPRCGCR